MANDSIVDNSASTMQDGDNKRKPCRTREELVILPHDKLVEKCLALLAELDTFRSQLRRSKKSEYAAKIKLTIKEKECNELQTERQLARWNATSDSVERKDPLMDIFVHDTLSTLNAELVLKKKEIDSLTKEIKILKAKKSSEFGREISEKLHLAMTENESLKIHQKKTSALEKQIALLQKANNTLKHNKRDADAELADRVKKIQYLEGRINECESRVESHMDDVSNTDLTEENNDQLMEESKEDDDHKIPESPNSDVEALHFNAAEPKLASAESANLDTLEPPKNATDS